MSTDPYRSLGIGYATRRRTDPRIEARITDALVGCPRVINVGAGTGSYEPANTVLAVDPSATMLTQRADDAAPAVRATTEALPLPDKAGDAALAVLTTHHWCDAAAGVSELVRVADRQVVVTWDSAVFARRFWLVAEYLPAIARRERDLACLNTIVGLLRPLVRELEVVPLPLPADCVDGVLAAHWQRPYAYLDPTVRAAASGLASLAESDLQPGLERLHDDLATGRWQEQHHDLLGRDHLDVGYRLIRASC